MTNERTYQIGATTATYRVGQAVVVNASGFWCEGIVLAVKPHTLHARVNFGGTPFLYKVHFGRTPKRRVQTNRRGGWFYNVSCWGLRDLAEQLTGGA